MIQYELITIYAARVSYAVLSNLRTLIIFNNKKYFAYKL